MEKSQKLLRKQHVILKFLFAQGQNATSSDPKNVGGTQSTPPSDQYYINMVHSQTLLQTQAKNYESNYSQKDKQHTKTSSPLLLEKPMLEIPKGVFKKTYHNPNVRVSPNYSIVEDLAQNPCTMSSLELLQSYPSQRNALLEAIGIIDSVNLTTKFDLFDVKPYLPYHVSFQIKVFHGGKTIG